MPPKDAIYRPRIGLSVTVGSNHRPSAPEADALPAALVTDETLDTPDSVAGVHLTCRRVTAPIFALYLRRSRAGFRVLRLLRLRCRPFHSPMKGGLVSAAVARITPGGR